MTFLLVGTGLVLLGALCGLLLSARPATMVASFRILVITGLALDIIPAWRTLAGHQWPPLAFRVSVPGGLWVLGLDGLSAWFLLIVCLIAIATTWYGTAYLAHHATGRHTGAAHATFALLIAAMIGVVTARSIILFLVAWEIMALTAYLLIVFEHAREEARRAGFLYLALTHAGTLALITMFLVWAGPSPDLSFVTLANPGALRPLSAGIVLTLALIGFGMKAGVVPLHFWLPGAHSAAPSHVSALLSGVMIKMGIYGLLRVIVLVGIPPAWWGWLVLGLGLASGILGILWALAQHDLKRVLAYSSVENIGIILLGIGTGVLGLAYGHPVVALLGFTGALLHSLNHALFKSLLFLGAGIVVQATGTRMIDRMGGLARRLPLTATAFLLGSAAIVGLPPLNGFVGEWVAAQALMMSGREVGTFQTLVLSLAGLGLITALALACFTRVYSTVFLGQPRTSDAAHVKPEERGMAGPVLGLAAICLLLGIAPAFEVGPASAVASLLLAPIGSVTSPAPGLSSHDLVTITFVGLLLLGVGGLLLQIRRALRASALNRASLTWGCGFAPGTARMQYTASSFSWPILYAFRGITRRTVVRGPRTLRTDPSDRVLVRFILPTWARIKILAGRLRPLQQGRVTSYLQYMVFTTLLLLGILLASVARSP